MCKSNDLVKEGDLFVCQACNTKYMLELTQVSDTNPAFPENAIFARWTNGYFYPGVPNDEWVDEQRKIDFLDGSTGLVSAEDILPLEDALARLELQGNWQNNGIFYKGSLGGRDPLVMHYNDGYKEQIQLVQLRGTLPGEKRVGLIRRWMGW